MHLVGKMPSGPWVRNKRMVSKEAEEEEGGPWLNLWLGNLSPDTVDEDLMAVFANYGAMDSVTSYLPRPYAFVYFRTIEDAKAAKQALHGIVIRGKPIRIEFARPAKPGKTLWVGGISQSVTKVQLENVFTKFGAIEEYRFLRHRGSAFICFHRIEDAIAAQKSMNWKHLGGSEIRVDFQRSPPLRRDWNADHDYMGSKNLLLTDQLLSTDEMKYFHDSSPHPGVRRQPPQGKRKDEQLSNVLWVGYPSELQIDEELLHNSMILFGEIERIQSFPSRNYCYVEFRSVDEARRAKEGLQGRLLGDNRIQILFSNSELIPGKENPPISAQEIFFNEPPPMGPVELFGPGHSMALNHFPGHLAPNVMPRANILIRPFNQGFDPHHGGSDFHEFGGGIHSFPDNIINNPMASNLKKLSPSAPGIITPGLVVHPPFRPLQPGRDEFDIREPKRSRLDGFFPPSDAHFPGRRVDVDDMADFSGLPHPDRNLLSHRQQTPDIRGHDHLRASPGIDFCWRGIIAKGGTPVCRARCLPIGNGIKAPFPDIVNCSARTGLDMLTTHYSEAVGFDMVFFLPDSEDDFASYTEFLRYLGQRDRAGVAKFDDGTTMFLVPPSDFLTKVLKYSGPERLYGVVLKLPQQNTTPGHQLQPIIMPPPPDTIDPHLSQKSHGFMTHNEDQSLKSDYGSSSHERPIPHYQAERPPRLVYSEEPHPIPSVSQDHLKIHETTPEVSLTPELIATLASLMPTNTHPSSAMPSHMPSNSASMPASFSAPPVNDNSMLMQGWGQQGRNAFSNTSVEQMYNPIQNFLPPMHQYSNQTPLIPQFPNYANSTNGMDNSFQPSMVGIPPMQEPSLHIHQVPGIYGTIGNTVSSQGGQFQAFQSNQATDVASMYGMPVRHQITPANPATTHNVNVLQVPMDTPVISDRLNASFPTQAQHFHAVIPGSGQEGDADKDQRYHSTLQFAASLLLQIQQQQQAKAQAAMGSGNQQ